MSRIDEFIVELCQNGVEYRTLGELGTFLGGLSGKSKGDFKSGNSKLITYMNVFSNIQLNLDVTDIVKINEGEKQNTIQYGDVLFTGSSETPNECGMSSVLTIKTEEKLYLNSFCFIYRFNDSEMFLPSFTKYLFRSECLRKQIIKTASGVTRFNVSKAKMAKVKIPVPPLEVQREIVRILDEYSNAVTELTAKLTAELTARKKQYEYYRDKLLDFGAVCGGASECEWRTLGEITKILRGKRLTKNQLLPNGKYPVYHGGLEPLGYYDKPNRNSNTVMIINVGASAGTVGYSSTEFWSSDGCFCIEHNEIMKDKFLYYYLSKIQNILQSKVRKAGIPTLDNNVVEKIKIPVLPIEEQERLVAILDRFDKLCNDIFEGLPAEIEARRKQYEYYRDKLLSFK